MQHLLEFSLRAEDVLDGVAGGAVSAVMIDYDVGFVAHFFAGVGHGHCESDSAHYREIDDVVAYVRYLDHPDDRGGQPLWYLGPVAEGAAAIILGLGTLMLAIRWIGSRG